MNEEKRNVLVVVDMQVDFVTGALGSKEAQNIIPEIKFRIEKFKKENPEGMLLFTMDTHDKNYLQTQEGRNLPIKHCIKGTPGWELIPELQDYSLSNNPNITAVDGYVYEKTTFGSLDLAGDIATMQNHLASVELVGVCTDICVISNALLIKANCPELPVSVNGSCCAGVTPSKHLAALEAMRSCQINIVGGELK